MLEAELALYSPAVSDAALWAVAQNAIRHLIEADEHFKKQRYASSLASAVLSVEETGKLHFLAFCGKTFEGNKHKGHQIIFVAALNLLAELPKTAPWQRILKQGLLADAALSVELQQIVAENPEFNEFIDALRKGALSDPKERVAAWAKAMQAKKLRDGTTETWRPFIDGLFHKLRMKATYVDIGETGEVTSGPSFIDAGNAEFMCFGALGLLMLAFGLTVRARLWNHRDDFTRALPEDITGMATFMQVVRPIVERAAAAGRGKAIPVLDAINHAVTGAA
jgi:hypothetical protein